MCMDGFETLGLGLKQASLLINSLAVWWVAVGREALAVDTAFTFFQNAQKTVVRGDCGYELWNTSITVITIKSNFLWTDLNVQMMPYLRIMNSTGLI